MKELSVKIPSEKETKIGVLFDLILEYISERVSQMTEKQKNLDEFIDT